MKYLSFLDFWKYSNKKHRRNKVYPQKLNFTLSPKQTTNFRLNPPLQLKSDLRLSSRPLPIVDNGKNEKYVVKQSEADQQVVEGVLHGGGGEHLHLTNQNLESKMCPNSGI